MPILSSNGINLFYEVQGNGEPILFIHGLGSSSQDWEMQTQLFKHHYQVVTFDVRGHGRSDKPAGPYSVPLFTADTLGLIKALDISPTHIIGISMGGMIAFQLALDAPERVKSMVIVNSVPELVFKSAKERLKGLQRLLIVHLFGMRYMGKVLSKDLFPKADQARLRENLIERWSKNDKRAYIDSIKALVGWSVAEKIGQISCPTLVISADEDYFPLSYKESYVKKIPNAILEVIQDSRHATPVDQPEKFNQIVMDFLAEQP